MEDDEAKQNNEDFNFDDAFKVLYSTKELSELNGTEIRLIVKMLLNLEYFDERKENFSSDQLANLANQIALRSFNKGEIVYNKGDEIKFFYLVLKGSVITLRQAKGNPDPLRKVDETLEHREVLCQGKAFGDYSILRNCLR